MKMFQNLNTEGMEETKDVLGGSFLRDTDIYTGKVTLAYAKNSASSDAMALAVHFDIDGKEYREDFWVTGRTGNNFYVDKKDPKKTHPLMGYTNADDLCLLCTDMGLNDQEFEEKTQNLYDFELKKDVPTKVQVITALTGKQITLAIVRQTVDKDTKLDDGTYVPSGQTADENTIDKFFHTETKLTVPEARAGLTEGVFHDKWKAKNAGQPPRNRVKNKSGAPGGAPGRAGAPGAAGAANKPKPSGLFGNK